MVSHGCPDLAKLVEANVGDPAGQGILDADIQANMDALVNQEKIDCCVLGCTHYPLVEKNIQRLYPGLPLIDPADQMAKTIAGYLQENGLVNARAPWTSTPPAVWRSTGRRPPRWASIR